MKSNIVNKILQLVLVVVLVMTTFSCSNKTKVEPGSNQKSILNLEDNINRRRIGIAYFSFNDDVKEVAEKFKEAMDADIFEIEPVVPYKDSDMDYSDKNSRVYLEDEFDPFDSKKVVFDDEFDGFDAVPKETIAEVDDRKLLTKLPSIKSNAARNCQIIILGFPVWYDNAPKVIYTFLKDLKNKIIIPFCTNGEMGMVDQYLSNFVDPSVRVMSGKRFDKDVSVDDVKKWVTSLSADFDIS